MRRVLVCVYYIKRCAGMDLSVLTEKPWVYIVIVVCALLALAILTCVFKCLYYFKKACCCCGCTGDGGVSGGGVGSNV